MRETPAARSAPPLAAEIPALLAALALDPPGEILAAEGYAPGLPLPWWAKLCAKLVLARLPISYRLWREIGLFRHGEAPSAVAPRLAVYAHHTAVFQARTGRRARQVVEIGPGDSLATAVLAHAEGAQALLVDAADHATRDMRHYRAVARAAGAAETARLVETARGRDAMLDRLRARYETGGVAALSAYPDGQVDLLFSNAVVEHLPLTAVPGFFAATARLLSPGGIASHGIDLHDHLGGGLNHWRFAPRRWESAAFRRGGFYTNRLPFSAYVEMARSAGLAVDLPWLRVWRTAPLHAAAIHPALADRPPGDRLIAAFGMILTRLK
jgi:SAM-dependent methyltransferase